MFASSIVGRVLLAALGLTPFLIAQKTPDTRLDTDAPGSADSVGPQVVREGDAVVVVWLDYRNGASDIHANRSLDRGETWLASDVRIGTDAPGTGSSDEVQVAVSGGNVFVAWSDTRNGDRDVYFSSSADYGATWLADDVLVSDADGFDQTRVQLAVVGSNVYVAWVDARSGSDGVYFNKSTDGGQTWDPVDTLLTPDVPGLRANSLSLTATAAVVYAAWVDDRTRAGRSVYVNRSIDGGATWQGSVRVDNLPLTSFSDAVTIAAAESGVYVTWFQSINLFRADVWLVRSTDAGATWQTPRRMNTLGPGTNYASSPTLAADGASVYVAWQDWRNGLDDVYFNRSSDQGQTWLPAEIRIDTDAPGSTRSLIPRIAASGDQVLVGWWELQPLHNDIFANRSSDGGATWLSSEIRLSQSPPGIFNVDPPDLAIGDGYAVGVWADSRNFNSDIFFNLAYGTQAYGTGTPGSAGLVPSLSGNGIALLGSTVTIDAANALGGAPAALLVGGAKAATPILGGTLLVAPLIAPPVLLGGSAGIPGAGALTLPLVLPNDEVFVGLGLFFQIMPLDPGAPGGVAMTNGVELWIG